MTHGSPSPFRALLALLFSFITGFLSVAHAQTESASISGTVTDPTGAVVLRATVRLIEVDRGTQIEVATGSGGSYNFANVRPGHYRMEVEKMSTISMGDNPVITSRGSLPTSRLVKTYPAFR